MNKSATIKVGNFDANYPHSEDAELGRRLRQQDFKIYTDPKLEINPLVSNPISKVIERYLRWNFGPNGHPSLINRLKFAKYAAKNLVLNDLSLGDWGSAFISIRCILKAFIKY